MGQREPHGTASGTEFLILFTPLARNLHSLDQMFIYMLCFVGVRKLYYLRIARLRIEKYLDTLVLSVCCFLLFITFKFHNIQITNFLACVCWGLGVVEKPFGLAFLRYKF